MGAAEGGRCWVRLGGCTRSCCQASNTFTTPTPTRTRTPSPAQRILTMSSPPHPRILAHHCPHPNTPPPLKVLDDEAVSSKAPFISRIQQCFALRPAADGLLDLARGSFCRATEAIHALGEQVALRCGLPGLKVSVERT